MNYADTNWLEAVYITPHPDDREAQARERIVERFARKHGGQLAVSHIVLLETRNVFSRVTGEAQPREWEQLEADFDGRLFVDPMNWDLLRRECRVLFARYSWKIRLGTFDTAVVAAAKLAGGTRFLSFDTQAKALAAAEGLEVFPLLDLQGKRVLAALKASRLV
jgi:predicted nucleic acid-binding protein